MHRGELGTATAFGLTPDKENPMRILIAEDEPTSRLVLDRWLTKWGHEVVATENGQEAHEVLAGEDAPQLAILD